MALIAEIIHRIIQLFVLLLVVQAILSFFMDPYHQVRQTIDRMVNPFLQPIRRITPPVGGLDFSPLILIIILQVLDSVIYRLLLSF